MTVRKAFLAALSSASAMPATFARNSLTEDLYSPAQVKADLDGIWAALLDVGVEPFRASNRQHVTALYRRARESITSLLSVRQAWLTIAPVLGALNDAHVSLGFPGPLDNAAFAFPLEFSLSTDHELIVFFRRYPYDSSRQSRPLFRLI